MIDISAIRKEYKFKELQEQNVSHDPIVQFRAWLEEAIIAEVNEPTAMNVATVSSDGRPSARILLLKGVDNDQLIFYTNYTSRKGEQLAANPHAAITFFWPELERQVRIEGTITKVAKEESDRYFFSRPKESQVGAIASPQSKVIESRQALEALNRNVAEATKNNTVQRPEHWGGYALSPLYFEFWQGRPGRLHDRVAYFQKEGGKDWNIARLAP